MNLDLKGKNPTPRYAVDDTKDDFTITYYCGYTDLSPEGTHLVKKRHFYETRCACGNIEILTQSQINNRSYCRKCAEERRNKRLQTQHDTIKAALPEDIPDFRYMRFTNGT